jgi:hypothetical protein
MPPFEVKLARPERQSSHSKRIGLVFSSKQSTGVLKLQITRLQVKLEDSPEFIDMDFRFIPHNVDRSFYAELDSMESREYWITLTRDVVCSFDFSLVVCDKTLGPSQSLCLEGHREGLQLTELRQPHETDVTTVELGMIVRRKPRPDERYGNQRLVVCPEDGTPHEFGIFNRHHGNPTAAYIDIGRDGYRRLVGQHFAFFEWDRDTVASPPDDNDLWAVHVRNVDNPSEHGWIFRSELWRTDAKK